MKLADRIKNKLIQEKIVLKWQIMDLVRKKGMRWISYGRLSQYVLLKSIINRINLRYLFAAHRNYPTNFLTQFVCREKQLIDDQIDSLVDIVQSDHLKKVILSTIVLKNPDVRNGLIEKGVLLITFTEMFPFFRNHVACDQLLQYFYVVLEPSWAGYCDPNILFWTKYKLHPIIVQATEEKDYAFLLSLRSNLIPVSFGASDWVDSRIFRPLPGITKKYDAIYVTNYSPIKRHHSLFKAVSEISDPDYKVALVFGRHGDAKSEIDRLIDAFKVRKNVVIYDWLPQAQLNEILNMSKVNVLLSIKEGSNRSIFEGFFANVPGIVLKNNIGVKKDYINRMTGRLIREKELMETLLYFRTKWHEYNPREWAVNHISPAVTAGKLSRCLKKIAEDRGELWTRDIVPKVNAPGVKYLYPDDERSMLSSQIVLSLFLRTNLKNTENEQVLQDHVRRMCAQRVCT